MQCNVYEGSSVLEMPDRVEASRIASLDPSDPDPICLVGVVTDSSQAGPHREDLPGLSKERAWRTPPSHEYLSGRALAD